MKRYPSDCSDEEWAFAAPYLALVREDAPQRKHDLRRTFDAARYVVRTGVPWRYLPGDFPPYDAVFPPGGLRRGQASQGVESPRRR